MINDDKNYKKLVAIAINFNITREKTNTEKYWVKTSVPVSVFRK